jgi:hypothetical protein
MRVSGPRRRKEKKGTITERGVIPPGPGNPVVVSPKTGETCGYWMPAFAGMTAKAWMAGTSPAMTGGVTIRSPRVLAMALAASSCENSGHLPDPDHDREA